MNMLDNAYDYNPLYDKIKVLNEVLWGDKVRLDNVSEWMSNYKDDKERYHALYLLSRFMYFNSSLIREMLRAMYRDLYKYRKIEIIRRENNNTLDKNLIESKYREKLGRTRFLGVGNPSESGAHLLYYYRQENELSKRYFINTHDIMSRGEDGTLILENENIDHYVFIDDFCGSGEQAVRYSNKIVKEIKSINNHITVDYISLFSTKKGAQRVRSNTCFDYVETVNELDQTFECFNERSRYFETKPSDVGIEYAKQMCEGYGVEIMSEVSKKEGYTHEEVEKYAKMHSLGYSDGQLLIGLFHNTPNNTLPIFWCDESLLSRWSSIRLFRRYHKIY